MDAGDRSGRHAALHLYPEEVTNEYWMLADKAYTTLFPGESALITIVCSRKGGGGFLDDDRTPNKAVLPDIRFSHFSAEA